MIPAIARRELQLQARDGRLLVTGLLVVVLICAAVVAGWRDHARGEQERTLFVERSYAQWLEQPPKHPHRAASFGLYVAKPESPLAIFESGLRPHAGRTLWLEAHSQTAFSHAPADDDLAASAGVGERSGAALLQLLGGLLALVLGALSVSRERETGVLRQILAQDVSPARWVAGKYLGLASAMAVPLVPLALVVATLLVAVAGPGERMDTLLRCLAAMVGNGAYLLAVLAVGMMLSTLVRSSRAALIAALTLWVAGSLLAPRISAHLVVSLAPTPDATAYEMVIGDEFAAGFDGEPGWDARLKQLEQDTLARYGVQNLDQVPVGFSGLRMHAMTEWSDRVSDRQYQRLLALYTRQEKLRMSAAILAPGIAARSFSHAMAGMDWSHYRHFADAAEGYRREFNSLMNDLIVTGTRGQAWEMFADRDDWARVPRFTYEAPGVGWALREARVPAMVLGVWLLAAWALLWIVARRLRP